MNNQSVSIVGESHSIVAEVHTSFTCNMHRLGYYCVRADQLADLPPWYRHLVTNSGTNLGRKGNCQLVVIDSYHENSWQIKWQNNWQIRWQIYPQ